MVNLEKVNSVKVNPEIVFTLENGIYYVYLPSKHLKFEITSDTLIVLKFLSQSNKEIAIFELAEEYDLENVDSIIDDLLNLGILVKSDYSLELARKWKDWNRPTWTFHLDTRDVKFASSAAEEEAYINFIQKVPPPNIYKCDCGTSDYTVKLPSPKELKDQNIGNVFLTRRTCRNFIDSPISLQELSTLLFYTGGALFETETDHSGKVIIKTVPSPGARHSTEIYIYVQNCQEVKRGIYHYCVKDHCINFVSLPEPDFLKKALYNQGYFEKASVVLFFTCLTERTMWKYKTPKAYRQVHFEIGHYCQNFLLTGVALNLGVYQTGALFDSYVESYLEIDGCDEFLMYCAGAGKENTEIEPIESANCIYDFVRISKLKLPKKFTRFD